MSDLISREDLKAKIQEIVEKEMPIDEKWAIGLRYSLKVIDNAPTVKVSGSGFFPYRTAFFNGVRAGRATVKPQGEWIPVSERLPDDLEPVNITWINHNPEPYYKEIKDKPFTATGVYFNGQWYWWSTLCTDTLAEYSHNFDDVIDADIEVIAWQPLPEPYKKGDAV